MVSDTVDPPMLAEAKRVIATEIARLSDAEIMALAARIKQASREAFLSAVHASPQPGEPSPK